MASATHETERDASGNVVLSDVGLWLAAKTRKHFKDLNLVRNQRHWSPSVSVQAATAHVCMGRNSQNSAQAPALRWDAATVSPYHPSLRTIEHPHSHPTVHSRCMRKNHAGLFAQVHRPHVHDPRRARQRFRRRVLHRVGAVRCPRRHGGPHWCVSPSPPGSTKGNRELVY